MADLEKFYQERMFPYNGVPFEMYIIHYGYDIVLNYFLGYQYMTTAKETEERRIAAQAVTEQQMREYFDKAGLLAASGMEFEDFMANPGYEISLRDKTYNDLLKKGVYTEKDSFSQAALEWGQMKNNSPVERPPLRLTEE
jgi:hypothetical protein